MERTQRLRGCRRFLRRRLGSLGLRLRLPSLHLHPLFHSVMCLTLRSLVQLFRSRLFLARLERRQEVTISDLMRGRVLLSKTGNEVRALRRKLGLLLGVLIAEPKMRYLGDIA